MKTPTKIAVTILIIAMLGCAGFKTLSSSHKMLLYATWKDCLLTHFDSLANGDLKKINVVSDKDDREIDFIQIKNKFNEVDSAGFQKMLNSALSQNKLKSWNSMYYVFWFQEGEVENIIITFIFYAANDKSWSISYLPYNEYSPIKAGLLSESDLNRVDDKLNVYVGEFFTISQFDPDFNCINNKMIIGMLDEYPAIDSLLFPK